MVVPTTARPARPQRAPGNDGRAVPIRGTPGYRFRRPQLRDGDTMWRLVRQNGVLEPNSAYSYVMLAEHFADTCIVAEANGVAVGFVSAFISPARPDTVFVWQIGVAPTERGSGLGGRMLDALLDRPTCADVRHLEATIAPSNLPSQKLFLGFARRMGAECAVADGFSEELFSAGNHEPERLYRIGPFRPQSQRRNTVKTFEKYESNVRSYCRAFPTVFTKAKGYRLWDEAGREYIDFFAGAGGLNYGHNNPALKRQVIDYLESDGILHSLDMATAAKARFLERFNQVILGPRGMDYRIMFPGPTGTNSVESALKLARKVTGRQDIVSFTNAFHGMTLGSLAVTGNAFKRAGAGVPLNNATVMPFDRYIGDNVDSLDYMERLLEDDGSGVDKPAAVIVEAVQGEGGLNAARIEWLQRLADLCKRTDVLLILDDIQAGCGRTGTFFSFEPAGIKPDIICLSKSIGGIGLPFAITLVAPEHDQFAPGEHNGTFRGNNLAFVAAAAALDYWETDDFSKEIEAKAQKVRRFLDDLIARHPDLQGEHRGRGLMQGIAVGVPGLAEAICADAFEKGLILETSGPSSEVMKVMPPLIIDDVGLEKGLKILAAAIRDTLARSAPAERPEDAA